MAGSFADANLDQPGGDTSGLMSNPLTTLGDTLYENAVPAPDRLPGNTSTVQKFLSQTGDGVNSAPPSWQPVPSAGTLTYYFAAANSDLTNLSAINTTDLKMLTAPFSPKSNVDAANNTTADVILQTFATDPGFPGLMFIPAGQFEFHIHAERLSGARSVTLYGVFREVTAAGVNIGTIGTVTESTTALAAGEIEYRLFMVTSNTYTLASLTSRIVLDVHAVFGAGASTTVRMFVGGEADSHISLPSNTVDATNFVPYTGATADVDLSASHTISAQKLITLGGTSAQFVKGDGSLDSTSYLPSIIPTSIAGLKLWLKADAGVTMNGSNQVSAWADQSGNGNNFIQSGADSLKPVYTANQQNGLPALVFTGANTQYLISSGMAGLTIGSNNPIVVFVVAKTTSAATQTFMALNDGAATNTGAMEVITFNGNGYYSQTQRVGTVTVNIGTQLLIDASASTRPVVFATYTSPLSFLNTLRESGITRASEVNWYTNGVSKTIAYGILGAYAYGVGGFTNKSNWLTGAIEEIIVYQGTLNPLQVYQIEDYLIRRYAISGYTGAMLTPPNPIGNSVSYGFGGGTFTVLDTDHHISAYTAGGSVTFNLPTLTKSVAFRTYEFTRETGGANTCTIAAAGGQLIQPAGAASIQLTQQYQSVTIRGAVNLAGTFYWSIIGFGPISQFLYTNGVTASVATGTTVTHALGTTPTSVLLTPGEAGAAGVYASALGATTFTVNFSDAGPHTFYWQAIK